MRGYTPSATFPRWRRGRGAGGVWKHDPADFCVEEIPLAPPTGEGEHLWIRIEKRGLGTLEVVDALMAALGVAPEAVGYAGLKDREARTIQEFTIATRASLPPLPEGIEVLAVGRTRRRLRVGQLAGNRFSVRVRGGDIQLARERVREIEASGFPNYYGVQRVGGRAPADGRATLAGDGPHLGFPQLKFALSAYQALLFNEVLAERGRRRLDGDLDVDGIPTGPMFGAAMPWPEGEALRLERRILEREQLPAGAWRRFPNLTRGTRRKLWVRVSVDVERAPDGFVLAFVLPPGSYATVLLEEIV